jgi:hypothetical protein
MITIGSDDSHEIVLFSGTLGTQSVRVWLEDRGGGIALLSHDIGPGLERAFGTDEIETFLEVDATDVPSLAVALGHAGADPIPLLAARYRGDSMATSHLRQLLTEHGIPHRFFVV